VRLAPDVAFYAWHTEYVSLYPTDETGVIADGCYVVPDDTPRHDAYRVPFQLRLVGDDWVAERVGPAAVGQDILAEKMRRAVDFLRAAIAERNAGDEGLRDGLNLIVNATRLPDRPDTQPARRRGTQLRRRLRGSSELDRGGAVNSWWEEQNEQRRAAITTVLDSPRGRPYLDYAGGNSEFAAWLLVADATCARQFGVSIFDIADWEWRDACDCGERPSAALGEVLQADETAAMLLGGE
jgi:hypothetical protein